MQQLQQDKSNDWKTFTLTQSDLDFIYNLLLEKETPLSTQEISTAVLDDRLRIEEKEMKKALANLGKLYRPADTYQIGDEVIFPSRGNAVGKVVSVRAGNNPDIESFSAVLFSFQDGSEQEYAAGVINHALNDLDPLKALYPDQLSKKEIVEKFGKFIHRGIRKSLVASDDLFSISDFWFPKALLADVNIGYLHLAEAVMEMENGVPVPTEKILETIEYPADSNPALTSFSFNYALKQDDRFDEVGPAGKILWTLKTLEPEDVRKVPLTLRYYPSSYANDLDEIDFDPMAYLIHDEQDEDSLEQPYISPETVDFCVSYPHWKAGTLPLLGMSLEIFPVANENNHYIFDFIDEAAGETFPGWVVRDRNYVCGLKTWYRNNNIIPGSLIRIKSGGDNSKVILSKISARSSKDWIRTAMFDSKGRLYFETRQQPVSTAFDDRLAIYVENTPQLDVIWENNNKKESNFKKIVRQVFKELTRENPQGIVHFLELYAGLNMMRRCAPKELMALLSDDETFVPLDNLYFKLQTTDSSEEMNA